jgi:hypothetical protein
LLWKKSNRNTGISKYLSIITLNVNGLNSQKDLVWQIGSKRKIQQSGVYKKHTSQSKTHIKQAKVAILIWDKADFKQKSEEIRLLHTNKGKSPVRR